MLDIWCYRFGDIRNITCFFKLKRHRSLILKNNGLELLRLVYIGYNDVKITRLLSQILGNLALDETSHKEIIQKGEFQERDLLGVGNLKPRPHVFEFVCIGKNFVAVLLNVYTYPAKMQSVTANF